jgi:type IV pilus assembly protein PilW
MMKGNNQSGLTLIELLIAMGIAGALLSLMVMSFSGQSQIYNTQQETSTLQEDMWAALQLISRDIRMAGYDPLASGNFGVVTATRTKFESTQDFNNSGVLGDGPNETVQYEMTGNSLGRATNGGALQPIIDNITQLAFEYETLNTTAVPWAWAWNDWIANPPLTTLENIRVVKVCMQGRTPRQTSTATDTSTFNPPLIAAPNNWTPGTPGRFQYRTMCVEVQCRNFQD